MKTKIKMLTLSLITLLLIILNIQTTNAQCHIDDWTALKALYESTDGDNWQIRTGWDVMIDNQTSPPANCNLQNLYGVTLSGSRVSCLDLDGIDNCSQDDNFGNYLVGNLPPELNKLTFLKILRLSNNFLQGEIPPELDNISFLTSLSLKNNFLSGSIPNELGNLNFLEELDLTLNQLTGNIPTELGNLTFLKNLYLEINFLNGSLPPQLGNLTQLNGLLLAHNQLSGSLPIELANLINLETLYLNGNQLSGNVPTWLCNLTNLRQVKLGDNQFTGELPNCLCNLTNLNRLEINSNGLWGSYPSCYIQFCTQFTSPDFKCNADISDGNNFDITWEEFCCHKGGKCDTCISEICSNETCVYPGDLNHDGIVNNQDVSLSGLFHYQSGTPRAPEHQNTDWYPHPAQDWGILNNQNKDIKHHDCNGDGTIDEADQQVVEDNMGFTCCPSPPQPPPPDESDYQVMLHPTDEIYDGYLVMNVALERREGGDLTLQGGYFTVDYSDVVGDFSYVDLKFESISWLGVPNNNLWFENTHFPNDKKIEVGFTKTNYTNSTGSGVIGQLILEYDNSSVLLSGGTLKDNYQFRVHTIGMHQSDNTYILIEDQQLQVNLTSNCEPNWNINEDSPFQNLYQSSNNLTTNGFVIIGEDQEVEYKANRVRINSGFSAKADAKFKVRTGGCN